MKKILFVLIFLSAILAGIHPVELRYDFVPDGVFFMDSDINYNIFVNGKFLNTYSSKEITRQQVISRKGDKALINEEFSVMIAPEIPKSYMKSSTSKYRFSKDVFGKTSGLDGQNGLHDFPYLPEKDIDIGDEWISRSVFVMPLYGPKTGVTITLQVVYRLIGMEKNDGDDIALISANAVFVKDDNADILAQNGIFKIAGYCNFLVRFNQTAGNVRSIDEIFDYFYVLFDYSAIEISGTTKSLARMPKKDAIPELVKFDQSDDINVVLEKDNTIIITLVNVQFKSDSKFLFDSEKARLDKVAAAIKDKYSKRRMIITGHAASTGKPNAEMLLSEERAKEVLDYLVKKHGLNPALISYEGKGSTEPIGDNNTETGKSMNRRVEIKILPD
jgi:outer membrane protein OmpA-like peptidoglycan-associated protein